MGLAAATILAIALIVGAVAVLARGGGGETIRGTNGKDHLVGTQRADTILGRGAADVLRGRRGNDVLNGGTGGDRLTGGKGYDRLTGAGGSDLIRARDGHLDTVNCGPGRDRAVVDRAEDGVYDCERLVTPKSFQKGRGG